MKEAFLFGTLFLMIFGCGSPFTPTPEYKIDIFYLHGPLRPAEELRFSLIITPPPRGNPLVSWEQRPGSPAGSFRPGESGTEIIWTAPVVEQSTEFRIVARVHVGGLVYEATTDPILVLPPLKFPPTLEVALPHQDGLCNVVGEGTLLPITGEIRPGTNPAVKLQVLEGQTVLQEWDISEEVFQVDLEHFGAPGEKTITLRVLDSQGLYSEKPLRIINDPGKLEELARQFLLQYNYWNSKTFRLGVPIGAPITIHTPPHFENVAQKACAFWSKYTGIQFLVLDQDPASPPCVVIEDHTEEASGPREAECAYEVGPDVSVARATIRIFALFKLYNDEISMVRTLAHELGHALGIIRHTPWEGVMAVGIQQRLLLWPFEQRAIRILYSLPPGSEVR